MRILHTWNLFQRFPGGKYLFSRFLGKMVPYSGTIHPHVLDLEPGFARIQMADRKRVRNHLDCVHAVALMNLGEIASGLSFISAIPSDARAILVKFSIEFIKKARGTLVAESRCEPTTSTEPKEVTLEAAIKNTDGETVARVTALWKVGPKKA